MTVRLYGDAYLRAASGVVLAHTDEGGVVLDQSVFYPTGGGQAGDGGTLVFDGTTLPISTAIKGPADAVILVPEGDCELPAIGQEVAQQLDWDRRYRHMRMHSCLHLLSVVIPLPVSGGAITHLKGRLDFNIPDAPEDKEALEAELNRLIAEDYEISESWITDAELQANPGLVKTMSVMPPMGAGRVRLVRIGDADNQIDLQPCGGTHVARTGEIGPVRFGKIEKKGRENRRVNVFFAE